MQVILNGEPHPFNPPLTIGQLVEQLALQGKRIAIEQNGEVVPRSQHHVTLLNVDDRIEIIIAVGGG